jgi:hypothetical protein
MIQKILLGLLVALVVIQFIRPARNLGQAQAANDITHVVTVPDSTLRLLQTACYDCHSNHTNYPWYANVNPVGMWLTDHINEGKSELNFSEFATYTAKRQAHKFGAIAETIEKHDMPLNSYLWIHDEARLTDAQRKALINWADTAKAKFPAQP